MLTLGVEEEFYLIDPSTRELADHKLPEIAELQRLHGRGTGDPYGFDHEYQLSIAETRTGVCSDLAQLSNDLGLLRKNLSGAAEATGLSILAAGTLPTTTWRKFLVTSKARYAEIDDHYRDVVRRRATCGCHVHVGIPDKEMAVAVMNRVRPWLPVLLALSASSPFYEGFDTGYESYRNILWGGFPVAGPPEEFSSYTQYRQTVDSLVHTGAILDPGHIYWDVRLGTRYDTLEFRIADASPSIGSTVLQVALCRALVLTCMKEIESHSVAPGVPMEQLRAATWRAARSGLTGELVTPHEAGTISAPALVENLIKYVRTALEELGDWETVAELVTQVTSHGTSADKQRKIFAKFGQLEPVIDSLIAETSSQF